MPAFKQFICSFLFFFPFALRAQPDFSAIYDTMVLHSLKQHNVETLRITWEDDREQTNTAEWKFSGSGNLATYRWYMEMTRPGDPYPEWKTSTPQFPEDSLIWTDSYGHRHARLARYEYTTLFGITRRSFYEEHCRLRRSAKCNMHSTPTPT